VAVAAEGIGDIVDLIRSAGGGLSVICVPPLLQQIADGRLVRARGVVL